MSTVMASQSSYYQSRAAQQDSPYKFPTLPAIRHIRLLQLVSEGPQNAIEGDILTYARWRHSVVDLDNLSPPYVPISYVWGGPPKLRNRVSFGDGDFLSVTDSAAAILRSIIVDKSSKYYWMDALRINQEDMKEKSYQVPLMYHIYSSAEEVIAWAGEESSDSGAALDFVELLGRQFESLSQAKKAIAVSTLSQMDGCHYPSADWEALARFLERPFFRRIWIVQEMVAASDALLICGKRQLRWKELSSVMILAQGNGLERFISNIGSAGLSVTRAIRELVRNARTPTLDLNLLSCYSFDVTDARDRVFALLNISSDVGDEALAANYNKSAEDVFIDSATHLLGKRSSSIRILYGAGIGTRRYMNELPSWVPDWTIPPPGTILGALADAAELLGKKGFRESGVELREPIVVCMPDIRSIKLKAQMFGVVASIASPQPLGTSRFSWFAELSQLLPSDTSYQAGGKFFPDVLGRTLITDMNSDGSLADESCVENFLNFYVQYILAEYEGKREEIHPSLTEKLDSVRLEMSKLLIDMDGNPFSSKFLQESLRDPPYIPLDVAFPSMVLSTAMSSEICTALGSTAGQRRVYTTRDGYIGLGPPLIQKEDLVCLIYGAKVPFIIRRRSDISYSLVGESYVHGIMFGEGIGKGPDVEITLV